MSYSIRRQDSNSQPSDNESPPLTTKPGLPPYPVRVDFTEEMYLANVYYMIKLKGSFIWKFYWSEKSIQLFQNPLALSNQFFEKEIS